jgi:hypothetical protein
MANKDVKLCFNCMGEHLVKDCKAPRSVCPVKGCGEHYHAEAHKFIVNRRMKRKMAMGTANRYPVKNAAGDEIQAHLLQTEIDRFSDQCMLWHQDILDHHAYVSTAEAGKDFNAEEENAEEEAYAGVTFFGEREDFAMVASVDAAIDSEETDGASTPVDENDLVALAARDEVYGFGMVPLPTDSSGLPRYDLFCSQEPSPFSLHLLRDSDATPLNEESRTSDIESQLPIPASSPTPGKDGTRRAWRFNPCVWLGTLLIWMGRMLGGSVAAAMTDNVFLNTGGIVSLTVVDPSAGQGGPFNASELARMRCQGSAHDEAMIDTPTTILQPSLFSGIGGWPPDITQYRTLDKVSLCDYVEVSAYLASDLTSGHSDIAHAYASFVKELGIYLKVVDTGCSHHLFRSTIGLKNVRRLKHPIPVRGITSNPEYIRHVADHPNPWIGEVCIAPWATADLLSVGQLMQNGCSLLGKANKLIMKNPFGKTLFTAVRDDSGLFLTSDQEIKAFADLKGHSYVDVEHTVERLEPDAPEWKLREFIHGHFTRQQRIRAEAAWKLHSVSGHPSHQALGDQCEHGAFEGVKLTRADVDNAYKIFRICHACAEAKFKVPPARSSHSPPAPRTGHTLCMDLLQYKVPTLGGNTCVLIAVDEHTGAIFYSQLKRKTAENVEHGIIRIMAALNKYGHRVENVVFDDEAVLKAMEDRVALRSINCKYTAAGAHNKRVERTVQELKAKMRCLAADIPYALPSKLVGELLSASVAALNVTPNVNTGPTATPYQLVTGVRPHMRQFKFGQVGMCECRRDDSPETRAEWCIFLGTTSNVNSHKRVYIPTRGRVYSRRAFKEMDVVPREWGLQDRLKAALHNDQAVIDDEPAKQSNPVVQRPELPSDHERILASSGGGDPMGIDVAEGDFEGMSRAPVPQETPRSPGGAEVHVAEPKEVTNPDIPAPQTPSSPPRDESPQAPVAPNLPPGPAKNVRLRASALEQQNLVLSGRTRNTVAAQRKQALLATLQLSEDFDTVSAYRCSVRRALKDPDPKRRESAMSAIVEEIDQLLRTKAIAPVARTDIPAGLFARRVLPSHMFLKDKFLADGLFERIKARLVAGGDFLSAAESGETASPTVNPITVMTMINLAASLDLEISCHDIKGAFLVPHMDKNEEPIYIRLEGEVAKILCDRSPHYKRHMDSKGQIIVQLKRYLYGLPQAGRKWNEHMHKKLTEIGFQRTKGDPCAYVRGSGAERVICCIHVDDLMAVGRPAARAAFVKELDKHLELSSQVGKKLSYIGLTIEKHASGFVVSQEGYRADLCSRFSEDIAAYEGGALSPADATILNPDKHPERKVDRIHYLGMVMSLMYTARLTRADILLPVCYMATKSQSPSHEDYLKVCRIAKYLRDRSGTGVLYKRGQPIKAFVYCDSSHALYPDGKGQAGIFLTLGSGYIHARTSKLKMITLSSTESEMCVMSEGATYARWLTSLLYDFGYPLDAPIRMYMDNLSAIHLLSNDGTFARNKHITIRENYAKEAISDGTITVHHKRTDEMNADMLTKFKSGQGLKSNMHDAGMIYVQSGPKDRLSKLEKIVSPAEPKAPHRPSSGPLSADSSTTMMSRPTGTAGTSFNPSNRASQSPRPTKPNQATISRGEGKGLEEPPRTIERSYKRLLPKSSD